MELAGFRKQIVGTFLERDRARGLSGRAAN